MVDFSDEGYKNIYDIDIKIYLYHRDIKIYLYHRDIKYILDINNILDIKHYI